MHRKPLTLDTFRRTGRTSLFDHIAAKAQLPLQVDAAPAGHIVSDRTHLRFHVTYRTEQQARRAAFLGMALRRGAR